MDHIINNIKVDGHYCSGNIAEFWSMPDDERMYAHEVMLDQARGKIPMIAGCHHQSRFGCLRLRTRSCISVGKGKARRGSRFDDGAHSASDSESGDGFSFGVARART